MPPSFPTNSGALPSRRYGRSAELQFGAFGQRLKFAPNWNSALRRKGRSFGWGNANGVPIFQPRVATKSLPWVAVWRRANPERVVSSRPGLAATLSELASLFARLPSVAAPLLRQRWADCCNAFGVERLHLWSRNGSSAERRCSPQSLKQPDLWLWLEGERGWCGTPLPFPPRRGRESADREFAL